jgi:DNA-binding transcriptional ArsR family regulator
MRTAKWERQTSKLLAALGQPIRVQILLALAEEEACVCHLEARLGKRQAYISQHLMALRHAGILETRREGRYIYYRLADEKYTDLISLGAELAGLPAPSPAGGAAKACNCPHCAAESQP